MNLDAAEIGLIICVTALAASNLFLGYLAGRLTRQRDELQERITKLYQAEARRQGIHPTRPRGKRRADTTTLPVIDPNRQGSDQ